MTVDLLTVNLKTAEIRTARTWGNGLRIFLACQAVAFAVWLIPASVQIVQWPSDGPVRLGLLAPVWLLGSASGVALLATALLVRRTITAEHAELAEILKYEAAGVRP